MNRGFRIPLFFRMLIVDDRVSGDYRNREYRAFFTAFFKNEIGRIEIEGQKIPKKNIEIEFTTDPDIGVDRWKAEVFDLVLFDCDFYDCPRLRRKGSDSVYSRHQGIAALRAIRNMTHGNGAAYGYRQREAGKDRSVWLWTGRKDDNKDVVRWLESYELKPDEYFLSKRSKIGHVRSILSDLVGEIVRSEKSPLQQLERLIQSIRSSTIRMATGQESFYGMHDNPQGGMIVAEGQDAAGSLRLIGSRRRGVGLGLAVYPASIPSVEHWNDKKYLPLIGKVVSPSGVALATIVAHFEKTNPSNLDNFCGEFLKSKEKWGARRRPYELDVDANSNIELCGEQFPSRYFAAATPLTGVSVVGIDEAMGAFREKVLSLLDGVYGGVVLKTTYLDSMDMWSGANWPGLQIQSHKRTRVMYPLSNQATLWNTGRTAMETLPPEDMNRFLKCLLNYTAHGDRVFVGQTHRVVVSLGSKYAACNHGGGRKLGESELKRIWQALFQKVFAGLPDGCFPLVEINVRHYLRTISKKYIGGDEYLSQERLFGDAATSYRDFINEYVTWLNIIQEVAADWRKKLILKYPYRSDVFELVNHAIYTREAYINHADNNTIRERGYGIRGIAAINALKTPVPQADGCAAVKGSPEWLSNPLAWGDGYDKRLKHQMSGSMIAPYRNQLLPGIFRKDVAQKLQDRGVSLFVGGGIASVEDIGMLDQFLAIENCSGSLACGIQIGTWGLLSGGPNNRDWDWSKADAPVKPARPNKNPLAFVNCRVTCCVEDVTERCANMSKKPNMPATIQDPEVCELCDQLNDAICIKDKPSHCILELERNTQNANIESVGGGAGGFGVRICTFDSVKCMSCKSCKSTYYCDAFNRGREEKLLPPDFHDPRYCTGCALCAQVCPSGALEMHRPEEDLLVMISTSAERRTLLRDWKVPYIAYEPDSDIRHFIAVDKDLREQAKWLCEDIVENVAEEVRKKKEMIDDWIDLMWEERLGDKFIMGVGRSEYSDERESRKKACMSSARSLLEEVFKRRLSPEKATCVLRAVVWSQLIWSDPGQVFWDTPILVPQSRLVVIKQQGIAKEQILAKGEYGLEKGQKFRIHNYVVCAQRGVLSLETESSKGYVFDEYPDWYIDRELGDNRLGGLDARGYGGVLIKDWQTMPQSQVAEICGLPEVETIMKLRRRIAMNADGGNAPTDVAGMER